MPVWTEDELAEMGLPKQKILDEIEQEETSLKSILASLKSKMGGAIAASITTETERRLKQIENFRKLQSWLSPLRLVACEVPGDGNCGAWTLLSFEKRDPRAVTEELKEEVHRLRLAIADEWEIAATNSFWQSTFGTFSLWLGVANRKRNTDSDSKVKSEEKFAKHEPRTPPRIPKPFLEGPIDLCTPPKEPDPVRVIGAARGAVKAQPSRRVKFGAWQRHAQKNGARKRLQECMEDVLDELDGTGGGKEQDPQPKKKARYRRGEVKSPVRKRKKSSKPVKNEETGEMEQPPRKKRKRLHRTRVRTCEEKQMLAVKSYLGSIGLTWLSSQSFHSRFGPSGRCGDFTLLQQKLVNGELPTCPTCVQMLNLKKFSMEECQRLISEAEKPDAASPSFSRLKEIIAELGSSDFPDKNVETIQDVAGDVANVAGEVPDSGDQLALVPYVDGNAPQNESDAPPKKIRENLVGDDRLNSIIQELKQDGFLQVLPRDSHDKRIPIRCKACRSKRQPLGKIFECHMPTVNCVRSFIRQHCRGQSHLASVRRLLEGKGLEEEIAEPLQDKPSTAPCVPCQGYSLTHGPDRSSRWREEMIRWARFNDLSKGPVKHVYTHRMSENELVIHHEQCDGQLPDRSDGTRHVCSKCWDSALRDTAFKSALRFSHKYWAAVVCKAHLFQGEAAVDELMKDLEETEFWKTQKQKLAKLFADPAALQTKVRQAHFWGGGDVYNMMNTYEYLALHHEDVVL